MRCSGAKYVGNPPRVPVAARGARNVGDTVTPRLPTSSTEFANSIDNSGASCDYEVVNRVGAWSDKESPTLGRARIFDAWLIEVIDSVTTARSPKCTCCFSNEHVNANLWDIEQPNPQNCETITF